MPAGMSFTSAEGRRDMVSRRDAAIRLFDDEWQDWVVRAVGRQQNRRAPGSDDALTMALPSSLPALDRLAHVMQAGTYQVADSPLQYVPRAQGVEQAAVWVAGEDLGYDDIAAAVEDPRLPAQYAVAFALVYCDLAGIDVTNRRVWADRERIFGVLRDPGLTAWYQVKTTGRTER
tara:strand:- start:19 stop:543 length:525 start_codon:yes stop_codon:yes gene_type:complete